MLLLGCGLFWARRLLYVDDELMFGLVFVDWSSGIVHLLFDVESRAILA